MFCIQVFNGEKFERGALWYGIMILLFFLLVFLTLFSTAILGGGERFVFSRRDILSALLLLVLYASYWWYVRRESEKKVTLCVRDKGVVCGNKEYTRDCLQGFSIELDLVTGYVHNIILLTKQDKYIYTCADTQDNIEKCIVHLQQKIPFMESVHWGYLEATLRKLKI